MLRYNKNILKGEFCFVINIIRNVNPRPIRGVLAVSDLDSREQEKATKNYLENRIASCSYFKILSHFCIFPERERLLRIPAVPERVKKK